MKKSERHPFCPNCGTVGAVYEYKKERYVCKSCKIKFSTLKATFEDIKNRRKK